LPDAVKAEYFKGIRNEKSKNVAIVTRLRPTIALSLFYAMI